MSKTIYLAGPMEDSPDDGFEWRKEISQKLDKSDFKCIIPGLEELEILKTNNITSMKKTKEIDINKYIKVMRLLIQQDLSFVEKADIIVCNWNRELTGGTIHEIGYAYQLKKPIYLITQTNLTELLGWPLACFTKIFNSIDELILHLKHHPYNREELIKEVKEIEKLEKIPKDFEDSPLSIPYYNTLNVMYVVDIDGTVCDSTERIKKICNFVGLIDWDNIDSVWSEETMDEFLKPENILNDKIINGAERILDIVNKYNSGLIFLTGRNDYAYNQTRTWLTEKLNIPKHIPLIMRPVELYKQCTADCKEYLFKTKIYPFLTKTNYIFLEDDLKTIKNYSKYGLVLKAPECWDVIGKN